MKGITERVGRSEFDYWIEIVAVNESLICSGGSMVKRIIDIGYAKYRIYRHALCVFMEEAKQVTAASPPEGCRGADGEPEGADAVEEGSDEELERVCAEVMQLYREYARSESMDVLLRLKCLLEEVSSRYRSLALAEEVLHINSCLPYERRVPTL
jgi:hypothetical protein